MDFLFSWSASCRSWRDDQLWVFNVQLPGSGFDPRRPYVSHSLMLAGNCFLNVIQCLNDPWKSASSLPLVSPKP